MHFSSPKKLTTFCSRQRTSTQRGKRLAVDRGALVAGAPSHGTTGTVDNPALLTCHSFHFTTAVDSVSIVHRLLLHEMILSATEQITGGQIIQPMGHMVHL